MLFLGWILFSLIYRLVPLAVVLFLVISGVMRLGLVRRRRGQSADHRSRPPEDPNMIEGEFVDEPDDDTDGSGEQ